MRVYNNSLYELITPQPERVILYMFKLSSQSLILHTLVSLSVDVCTSTLTKKVSDVGVSLSLLFEVIGCKEN